MPPLYPLTFHPLLKRYIWGGRRLGSHLGKPIGQEDCAESWEIADHGEDQSVVAAGPLAGTTLHELVETAGEPLLGRHLSGERFPLLLKFLDASKTLSVQVHPDDEQAARLDPPDFGKTEAWIVLDAEPGAKIYAGLKRGFDRAALAREIARGTCELCLQSLEPKPGQCYFIPAGTVHALGAGLLVAEIQQSSDTTYRLFDWNRVGADGKPRPLHIDQALEVIDYHRPPVEPVRPQPTNRPQVQRLVECNKFVLDRWQFDSRQKLGGDEQFHIMAVLSGEVRIVFGREDITLGTGGTTLLPAICGQVEFEPAGSTTLLDIYLP